MSEQKAPKKRWGDRKDATLLRDAPAMSIIMPLMYKDRTKNEAYISELIDLTNMNRYLEEKNAHLEGDMQIKYTLFHVIVAAISKVLYLRPKMNRFIANDRLYQRNHVSCGFVVKKQFNDDGEEALAFVRPQGTDTMDDVHESIRQQVTVSRSDVKDESSESMDIVGKLPFWVIRAVVGTVRFFEKRGKDPFGFLGSDPYQCSAVLSNIGSLKMNCGYHHLTDWGTCSLFVLISMRKLRPYYDAEGNVEMRDSVELGLTIDERIADGYYYSRSIRLLKTLLEDPWLLDRPLEEEVEY